MKLYIFRHGETTESKYDLSYSQDRKLTADILDETVPVIEKLGSYLAKIETDVNLTSPVKRCLQTVQIIKMVSGKEFETNENLKEWMDPMESFDELVKRVQNFYNKIQESEFKNPSICTHGAIIAGLKSVFEIGEFPITRLHDYPMPGVLLILDTTSKKCDSVNFNL